MSTPDAGAIGRGELRCWHCGGVNEPAPVCPECGSLVPLPADVDHYRVFGLPTQLAIDNAELERRYYALSRLLHPDRHHQEPAEAQEAAMQNTAALTRAYRTLRDPISRSRYWLELHGDSIGADNNSVPSDLAALVFEVQEEIEACGEADPASRGALAQALRARLGDIDARRERLLEKLLALFAAADALPEPTAAIRRELKALLSSRAYLETLARDIGRALENSSPSSPAASANENALGGES